MRRADTMLSARVSAEQLQRWRAAARDAGCSMSAWIAAILDSVVTGQAIDWERARAVRAEAARDNLAVARERRWPAE